MSEEKQIELEIYIVGRWVDTGPGYNDCIFEAGYVTSDLSKAKESVGGTVGNFIMKASDGSYFHDWEQGEIVQMKDASFEAIRQAGGDAWDGLDVEQELAAMRGQPQGTEASVCDDICERQALGINKYGKTVSQNPLELRQWLQHAYEEALDMAIYLKRAIEKIDGK